MQNLGELTDAVAQEYGQLQSLPVLSEKVAMSDSGFLQAGKKEYPLTPDAICQFAHLIGAPADYYTGLDSDIRAAIFNRIFPAVIKNKRIADFYLILNGQKILGYDDPTLHRIEPTALLKIFHSALPAGLRSDEIEIPSAVLADTRMDFSCVTPTVVVEPQLGDIINGGIHVHYSVTGQFATQIRCHFHRCICSNGSVVHVCKRVKRPRSRRLASKNFSQADMVLQLRRLMIEAWNQVQEKLLGIPDLLNMPPVASEFLEQQRTRLGINKRIITAIENAIEEDELATTHTQYDVFNAISRVATYDSELSLRQRRTLLQLAGEFSQNNVRRCSECGSWVAEQNTS